MIILFRTICMKKILALLTVLTLIISCGGNSGKEEPEVKDISKNPDYQKGLELATKYKCFVCHAIDDKLTAPPYRQIANKYGNASETQIADLAQKIIKGGTGVWGNVPMIAHPDISEEDAKAMVRYILLLKK